MSRQEFPHHGQQDAAQNQVNHGIYNAHDQPASAIGPVFQVIHFPGRGAPTTRRLAVYY